VGQGGDRQHGLRFRPHGVQIIQAVLHHDLPKHKRVIHQRIEKIDGMHHQLTRWHPHHCRIIRRRQAHQHISRGLFAVPFWKG
jgi:hypothetical protein